MSPPAATVQEMFTSIARVYDFNNTLLSFGLHHYWKAVAVRETAVDQGALVLDVGTGTADLAMALAPRVAPGGRIYAVDVNPEMLDLGRRKIEKAGLEGQVVCLLGDALALQFKPGQFDAVTIAFCLRNVEHLMGALTELYRVLRPGGRAVCLEFSLPTSPWLRRLYQLYAFRILPVLGAAVSGDHTGVYTYLPRSIWEFPRPDALRDHLLQVGFREARWQLLTAGVVAVHVASK